jgi:hypothetical protein
MPTPPTFVTGSVLTAAQMNTIGMHLVKRQTISSGGSGVNVTDAFNADYDNYRIVASGLDWTIDSFGVLFFLGTYGATGYYGTMTYYTVGVGQNFLPSNNTQFVYGGIQGVSNDSSVVIDIMNPYTASATTWTGSGFGHRVSYTFSGGLFNTTQYTGFQFAAGSGTLNSGTIRVYGYRN